MELAVEMDTEGRNVMQIFNILRWTNSSWRKRDVKFSQRSASSDEVLNKYFST